jgi:hypothetical protein
MQGDATQFGEALLQLIRSQDGHEAETIWRRGIDNVVFAQNGIYDAAVPAIDVMLAALVTDRPTHVKGFALELLFYILNGGSAEEPDLSRRCSERAIKGIWLLMGEAVNGPEWVLDAVLDIMDILDPTQADALRSWVNSS